MIHIDSKGRENGEEDEVLGGRGGLVRSRGGG